MHRRTLLFCCFVFYHSDMVIFASSFPRAPFGENSYHLVPQLYLIETYWDADLLRLTVQTVCAPSDKEAEGEQLPQQAM